MDQPPSADAPRKEPDAIPAAGLLGRGINALSTLFSLAIIASAAVLVMEIALRYVFNAPTIWAVSYTHLTLPTIYSV